MSIKLNVDDRVLSAHGLDLRETLIENLSDVILQHGSVLPCNVHGVSTLLYIVFAIVWIL